MHVAHNQPTMLMSEDDCIRCHTRSFPIAGWEEPNRTASLYHSFNIGQAHVVGINTEAIEYGVPNPKEKERMLTWLEDDMQAANAQAARAIRPWIIVHFHRPAYSTGNTDVVPYEVFEPLMYRYGVDVVFQGHVHNQERTYVSFLQNFLILFMLEILS